MIEAVNLGDHYSGLYKKEAALKFCSGENDTLAC